MLEERGRTRSMDTNQRFAGDEIVGQFHLDLAEVVVDVFAMPIFEVKLRVLQNLILPRITHDIYSKNIFKKRRGRGVGAGVGGGKGGR